MHLQIYYTPEHGYYAEVIDTESGHVIGVTGYRFTRGAAIDDAQAIIDSFHAETMQSAVA
jgi:hypothetical protein